MNRASFLALPLLLSACSGSAPSGNQSGGAGDATPTPAQTRLTPGQWQTDSEIVSFEMPGMPPSVKEQARAHKGSSSSCLTPEQAARPASDFFNRSDARNDCRTENFAMADGRISAAMSCSGTGQQGQMRIAMEGRYEPTSYDVTSTMTGTGPMGEMKVVAHTTGRRTGECTARTPPAPKAAQ